MSDIYDSIRQLAKNVQIISSQLTGVLTSQNMSAFTSAINTQFSNINISLTTIGVEIDNIQTELDQLVIPSPAITAIGGDATGTGPGTAILTLNSINPNPGIYGSGYFIPQISVNGKGLITNISQVSIIETSGDVSGPLNNITVNQSSANAFLATNDATIGGVLSTNGGLILGNGSSIESSPTLYAGSGIPSNSLGSNGNYWFRNDTPGIPNQNIYVNQSGNWISIL